MASSKAEDPLLTCSDDDDDGAMINSDMQSLLSSELSRISLENINDDLLIEILCRLPSSKSAVQCKTVSKRWCSLISTPCFIRQYCTRRGDNHILTLNHHHQYAVVISYMNYGQLMCHLITNSHKTTCLGTPQLILPFILQDEVRREFVTSFNDLIVYRVSYIINKIEKLCEFYIVNPFTKQSVMLPPHVSKLYQGGGNSACSGGLLCESYFRKHQGNYTPNHENRYRLVIFTKVAQHTLNVATYCSETKEWNESVLEGFGYEMMSNIIPCNGRLNWYNGQDIVAYDPFDVEQSFFIWGSDEMRSPRYDVYCIGVCGGLLRVIGAKGGILRIWELEQYRRGSGEWKLYNHLCLRTVSLIQENMDYVNQYDTIRSLLEHGMSIGPVCVHPMDRDRVYLRDFDYRLIMSCNLRTKELKLAAVIPDETQNHIIREPVPPTSERNYLPIVVPLWPTPIPT